MNTRCWLAVAVVFLWMSGIARAGLYYSGEPIAELPSQWRGFLLDQRALRNIAVKPTAKLPASPMRQRYEEAALRLEKSAKEKKLTPDELADLGALYVRLGEVGKAIEVLRPAQREHGNHFRITANLGTAWQLQGDLNQAAACLQHAVRLSPGKLQTAEEYQLKLVQLRQRESRDAQPLDDLFGVRFVGKGGQYEPGTLAADQQKKLPTNAAAIVQQLALWLPADARLLWQLAELAGAYGDVRTAASIMDGCVTEFGLHAQELRQHRQLNRAAADELAKKTGPGDARTVHEGHVGGMTARSKRPLLSKADLENLPPIQADGINALPWAVLADTSVDRQFRPNFSKYLKELEGKQVSLTGFMQPLSEELDVATFMLIEYPIGCWYCEMPEITSILLVELPPDKTVRYTRSLVKIQGKLSLNSSDPENFLYTIGKARVGAAD